MQVAQAKKFSTRKTGQRRVVRQKTRKLKSLHFEAPAFPVKLGTVRFKKLRFVVNAPKIELAIEPQEGNNLVYHPLPGWTSKERRGGQLSVLLYIRNKESKTITLKKVAFVYGGRTKEVSVQKKIKDGVVKWDNAIAPNKQRRWINGRGYHQVGDVIYFESGVPSSITIKLYFKEFTSPVSITKRLKPYRKSFALPFKASDLRTNELWESASTHGGGYQVFAYDMGVQAPGAGSYLPGKSGSANSDYRIWGKRIYAMADGVVKEYVNNVPENPRPGQKADFKSYQRGYGGNHFYIQHGGLMALYAHFQKGSLNPQFMKKNAVVKKGDFLGLAGNSGNSTAPHLHIHVRKETRIESGPFRPLVFTKGFVIGKANYPRTKSNVNWSYLNKLAIPGKEGKRSYIWPSGVHPYCGYSTRLREVAKHGVSESRFQGVFDKIHTCGYYPVWLDGYNVGGKTFFNLIFRRANARWQARINMTGARYQKEFKKWTRSGYRPIHVDSYLRKGKIRYAALWKKSKGFKYTAYHGKTANSHQKSFEKLTRRGYAPVNVSSVVVQGRRRVTALYEKKNVGGFHLKSEMTLKQYNAFFKQYNKRGFKLVYLNGFNRGSKPRLSGIWYKKVPYSSYWAKHYLNRAGYQREYNSHTKRGYLTRVVTGYQHRGHRLEGIWYKGGTLRQAAHRDGETLRRSTQGMESSRA